MSDLSDDIIEHREKDRTIRRRLRREGPALLRWLQKSFAVPASLRQLADEAEVSAALLSQIATGQKAMSADLFLRLTAMKERGAR